MYNFAKILLKFILLLSQFGDPRLNHNCTEQLERWCLGA